MQEIIYAPTGCQGKQPTIILQFADSPPGKEAQEQPAKLRQEAISILQNELFVQMHRKEWLT